MNNFRPEHIAQQSRQDKLRIQHDLGVYVDNNLVQIPPHYAHVITGNICYDPSEFINFSINPHVLKDTVMGHQLLHQESDKRVITGDTPMSSSLDPQYFSNWVANPISALDVKHNYLGYQEIQNTSGVMNGNSSLYHNSLQNHVTSSFGLEFASLRRKISPETSHGPWVHYAKTVERPRRKDHGDFKSRGYRGDKGLTVVFSK